MSKNSTRFPIGLMLSLLFITCGLCIAVIPMSAQGTSSVQVSVGSDSVGKGAEVCVPVRLSNFNNIVGMEFSIIYDTTRLQFKSVRNFNLTGLTESNSFGLPGTGINKPGAVKVSWLDPSVSGVTVPNGTVIFQVCFTAANVDATTSLNFGGTLEVIGGNGNPLPLVGVPGTIKIGTGVSGGGGGTGGGGTGGGTGGGGTGGGTGGGGTGGGTGSTGVFTLNIADTTIAATNQAFCLNARVGGFANILGVELTINYNPAHLTFDSLSRFNLTGLNASSFGLPGSGTNPLGTIKLSWVDPNVQGVSVSDSTVIFALCFKATANNISTAVTFASAAEVIDKNESPITFNGIPGYVVIGTGSGTGGGGTGGGGTGGGGTGGGGTGGTIGTGTFTLKVGNAAVALNQSFCLDVKVASFRDIIGAELAINYNTTQLVFDSLVRMNLIGLNASSFGLPGTGSNLPGSIKMSWVDPNVTGVSIVDSTVIFALCFRAIQNNITAQVGFGATAEIVNKSEAVVPFNGLAGFVKVGTGGSGSGGSSGGNFALTVASATVASGQQVCLPVTVTNFTGILGMEFTVNYDATRLQFQSVDNLTLAGLTREASFGLPGTGANPLGSMKISWNDPEAVGKTLTDGAVLFRMCFTAIGASNTTTTVGFASTGEIVATGDRIIPFTRNPGTVTISSGGGGGGSTNNNLSFVVGNKTSAPNQRVCLDVKVAKFTNILGMEFSMTYNAAALMFDTVQALNLTGLTLSNFGLPGQGVNQPGSVKLSWVDPNVTGITLPDSTAIFQVCFKPIGSVGTVTPVSISPQQLEVTNASEQAVPVNLVNGSVAIQNVPAPGSLFVEVESKTVSQGQDFCLNLSVTNFTSIIGMEFNLVYNTDSLTFKSVGAFNLSGLSETSFGIPGVGVNPLGNLKLSWLDPDVRGISLVGKVNIFQVCFTAKAATGTARVRFDTQKIIEITNAADQQVQRSLVNGVVTFQNNFPPLIIASPAQITNVRCFGASTGAINITPQGGSGNYSYRWNYQNATSRNLANLPAGSYSVTVTDTLTKVTVTQTYTVAQPAAGIQITSALPTPTCFGLKTGRITLTVQGGSGMLAYAWSGGLPAVASPTGIGAGSYTVTITDTAGCQLISNAIVVTQPDSAVQVRPTAVAASCKGLSDGRISIVTTGGTGPYTYAWSNNLPANLTTQTGLAGGSYSVTATDARGCTGSATAQIGLSAGVSVSSIQPGFIDAGNDGNINIGVTGGVTPYQFSWVGPGNFSATSQNITGLGVIGDYCVTVTDSRGCKDTACAPMVNRLRVGTGSIRDACSGGNDGSITINPTGGRQPYTFRWNNGGTVQNLSGLEPGTYVVTITDVLKNTVTGSFDVVRLSAITIGGTVMAARGVVGVANGSISASITGGKPEYTFRWANGATTSTISGLAAGQYCLTVTDKNGCTASRCYEVPFEPLPLAFTSAKTDNRCFGEAKGVLRLNITGGIGPYSATFNDGVKINANKDGLLERTGLAAGVYSFVISDSLNMTIQGNITLNAPAQINIAQTTVRHDNENLGCTGGITISLTGGTAPYLVRWNSNNGGTLITNLCEGDYVATVEDGNGCMTTFPSIKVNTFGFTGNIIDNLCPGDLTGDILLNVFGGASPYAFFWLNSRGDTILRNKDLMNVAAGTYRVVVQEPSGNTLLKQFVIGTQSNLSASAQVVSNYRGFGVSCPTSADGIASASGLNGIGSSYMYEWLSGQQLVGSQQRLQNAKAGTYVVRITDQGGCMTETTVTLTAPPQLGINASVNNISCPGARDGDILITASGGVPGSVYGYRWSTGATSPRISFLPTGNYSATVTDANNCTFSAMFNIAEPLPLSVKVETTPATVGVPNCDGAARITVTGGTRPYAYVANVPNNRTTDSVFLKLCPGDYVLQIRDARGCKTTPEQLGFNIQDRTLPCLETRSVLTPDGDGANDNFEIFCIDELKDNRLVIFNKWGQLVFEQLNYANNWVGRTSGGEELPEGAYYYILEYTDKDGTRQQVRGSITILRN